MKVLVDTPIWSLALRRQTLVSVSEAQELNELIQEARIVLIGPIRQEILSRIRSQEQFVTLKSHLRAFQDFALDSEDYELAAEYFNLLRSKGIQGSNTDFLLCAVAKRHELSIFTTDQDFVHFKKHLPIILHEARN